MAPHDDPATAAPDTDGCPPNKAGGRGFAYSITSNFRLEIVSQVSPDHRRKDDSGPLASPRHGPDLVFSPVGMPGFNRRPPDRQDCWVAISARQVRHTELLHVPGPAIRSVACIACGQQVVHCPISDADSLEVMICGTATFILGILGDSVSSCCTTTIGRSQTAAATHRHRTLRGVARVFDLQADVEDLPPRWSNFHRAAPIGALFIGEFPIVRVCRILFYPLTGAQLVANQLQ